MKHGVFDHPKLVDLAQQLSIPRYAAGGLLARLWEWTAEYAPAGDVGRYADNFITGGLFWEGDAATVLDALVAAGWLDRHETHRLLIHDWPDHCEESVHKKLARAGLYFANGVKPNTTRLTKEEKAAAEVRYAQTGRGRIPE